MAPKRVALKSIKSLTFQAGQETIGRRTDPIPQLQCHGKACRRYQPDVVQCQNMGDDGAGSVQWKCDADLPEGMRFGRIEVSCEGWTRAGDTNVMAGSCGLSYDLVTIDKGLERGEYSGRIPRLPGGGGFGGDDMVSTITQTIAILTTCWVMYNLFSGAVRTLWRKGSEWLGTGGPHTPGGGGGGGGGGGPGFGGGGGSAPPPPPYSKLDDPTTTSYPPGSAPPAPAAAGGTGGMAPGFWTGLAAGGAATYFLNRRNADQAQNQNAGTNLREPRGPRIDWEDYEDSARESERGRGGPSRMAGTRAGMGMGGGAGEGSMRRATAFGSSSTR